MTDTDEGGGVEVPALPAAPQVIITEVGVFDVPEDQYHRDPVKGGSLSYSGAKRILPPSSPAMFRYVQDNPPPTTATFSFGHAAHAEVLGVGAEIVVVDAADWRTKAAREAKVAALAAGKVPMLPPAYAKVQAMAARIREHPLASILLEPDEGTPEASMFWRDDETGVMRRSRLDYLPDPQPDGRLIICDYKTAESANPAKFRRAAADYGYYIQAPYYQDGVLALGLADDVRFVFIVQEKNPPYLVSVVELDADFDAEGRRQIRIALDTYDKCTRSGVWPGYSSEIVQLSPPPWFVSNRRDQEQLDAEWAGDYDE